jgi:hydroxyethylthiazole kinase
VEYEDLTPYREEKVSKQEFAKKAGDNLELLREKKPLVHNITNYVVMNWTANILLAIGASPVMAHAHEEVEEMTSFAGALVLNIGTLTPYWIDSMVIAGKKANALTVPVILDPVGSGATKLRTDSARRILDEVRVTVVRGNASEVLSLAQKDSHTKGVDSIHRVEEAAEAAASLASELKTVLAITGAVDLITNGDQVEPDAVKAAASALAYFGLAGEKAAAKADGPGSFQPALLDALYNIKAEHVSKGAKIF